MVGTQSIPKHLWEKNTGKSMFYLARDVAIVATLAVVAITLNNPFVWPLYWLAQGTMYVTTTSSIINSKSPRILLLLTQLHWISKYVDCFFFFGFFFLTSLRP